MNIPFLLTVNMLTVNGEDNKPQKRNGSSSKPKTPSLPVVKSPLDRALFPQQLVIKLSTAPFTNVALSLSDCPF